MARFADCVKINAFCRASKIVCFTQSMEGRRVELSNRREPFDSRERIDRILKSQIENQFFPDIANNPEALREIWQAGKLKLGRQSLPHLNATLVRKIFIEPPERQWQEAEATMETVTKAGPHIVVYKETPEGYRDVFGTCRLQELSQPYQAAQPASYRMYMQDFFVKGLLHSENCVLTKKKFLKI